MKRILTALLLVVLVATVFVPNTAKAATCGATYTVQSGDYLYKISRYCGVAATDIIKANPKISNWNLIYPGQVLNLVKTAVVTTPAPSTGTTTTTTKTGTWIATLSANPKSGMAGGSAYVSGTGYDANGTVTLYMGRSSSQLIKVTSFTADGNGNFSKTVTLPSTITQGVEYMFLARSNNHLGTLYHFKVGTGVVASNTTSSGGSTSVVVPSGAKFLMDSSTFKPGATIKFEVQGFPKSVDVDVQLRKVGASPAVIIDGKTDTEGRISKIVTIPSSAVAGEKWEIWVGTTQLTPGTAISSGAFTIQ